MKCLVFLLLLFSSNLFAGIHAGISNDAYMVSYHQKWWEVAAFSIESDTFQAQTCPAVRAVLISNNTEQEVGGGCTLTESETDSPKAISAAFRYKFFKHLFIGAGVASLTANNVDLAEKEHALIFGGIEWKGLTFSVRHFNAGNNSEDTFVFLGYTHNF